MIKQFSLATTALFFVGAAFAGEMNSPKDYTCSDGSDLSVAYVHTDANTGQSSAFAVLLVDGKMHIAPVAVSASGARYVAQDDSGYSWHVKRGEGLLTRSGSEGQKLECSVSQKSDVAFFVGGDAECDVDVSVYDDHAEYALKGSTKEYQMCDFRVESKRGQKLMLKWESSSNHEVWVIGADKSTPLSETSPYTVKADGEVKMHITLPRAFARRASSPKPFSLTITVE